MHKWTRAKMAEEDFQVVRLEDNFYRDSFGTVIFLIISVCISIALLVALSIYLHLSEPQPINFKTAAEWRIQPEIPIDQPYLSDADLFQWTANAMRTVFVFNFNEYNEQLKSYQPYFTAEGWKVFQDQLNNYASSTMVSNSKLFVTSTITGAPTAVNRGILSGRFAWWVEIPVDIAYQGSVNLPTRNLTLQVLVVRVSTLNNLSGVAIDNVIVTNGADVIPSGAVQS